MLGYSQLTKISKEDSSNRNISNSNIDVKPTNASGAVNMFSESYEDISVSEAVANCIKERELNSSSVNSINSGHIIVQFLLNKSKLAKFLVDTGATHSLIKECTNVKIKGPSTVNLISVTGQRLDLRGHSEVLLSTPDVEIVANMNVVPIDLNLAVDGILGSDFFKKNRVKISYADRVLEINDVKVPFMNVNNNNNNLDHVVAVLRNSEVRFTFKDNELDVRSSDKYCLPPFTRTIIMGTVKGNEPIDEKVSYIVQKRKLKNLDHIPCYVAESMGNVILNEDNSYTIPVLMMNLGKDELIIHKGRFLSSANETPYYQKVNRKFVHQDEGGRKGCLDLAEEYHADSTIAGVSEGTASKLEPPPITGDMLDVDEMYESDKPKLVELLQEYRDVISIKGEPPGRCKTYRHEIVLDTHKPLYTPQYRVPHKFQAPLDQEISEMLEQNIIRESKSPYNSPVLAVPKPDNSIRLCVDLRQINRHVIPDRFPLPILSEVLQQLSNNQVFSTLDAQAGFWQIELEDRSKEKTAFSTRQGHYEFEVMPFGLKDAASSFERMMMMTLSNLVGPAVLVYLDDVIVFGKDVENHLSNLRKVLGKLRENGIKLRLEKCNFLKTQVKYLGHLVSRDGISMDPSRYKVIEEYQPPKDKDGLRSFLGLMSYFRSFVPNFSMLAEPLNKLLRKGFPYQWTITQEDSFNKLKQCLLRPPVLKYPNFDKEFYVATDASSQGIGAALLQEYEGRLHPISYASKSLSKSERNYSTTKREALAVVWGLRQFKYIILGYDIIVLTDHKPLLALFQKEPMDALMARWMLRVQNFVPLVKHLPGKQNILADLLSRGCTINDLENATEAEVKIETVALVIARDPTTQLWINSPWDDLTLSKYQEKDPFFGSILGSLKSGTAPKKVIDDFSSYYLQGNVLYKVVNTERLGEQVRHSVICVPDHYLTEACKIVHVHSGHAAFDRSLKAAVKLIYNPRLEEVMRNLVKHCDVCVVQKSRLVPQPLGRVPIPDEPFEVISMDFLGPLDVGADGNRYVLVITDYLTRYLIAVPTVDRLTSTVTRSLRQYVFTPFNVPMKIITDNAAEFCSMEFMNFNKIYGIDVVHSTPYHPHGNGLAEASVKKVLTTLKLFCSSHDKSTWDLFLSDVVTFINDSYNSTLGDTPFYSLFKMDKRHPLNKMKQFHSMHEDLINVGKTFSNIRNFVQDKLIGQAITESLRRNAEKRQVKLNIGDRVFVHHSVVQEPHGKFSPTYVGPYKVVEFRPPASYVVKNLMSLKTRLLHKDKLLPAGHIFVEDTDVDNSAEINEPEGRKKKRSTNVPKSDRVLRSMHKI